MRATKREESRVTERVFHGRFVDFELRPIGDLRSADKFCHGDASCPVLRTNRTTGQNGWKPAWMLDLPRWEKPDKFCQSVMLSAPSSPRRGATPDKPDNDYYRLLVLWRGQSYLA